jgi:hypothetical protein
MFGQHIVRVRMVEKTQARLYKTVSVLWNGEEVSRENYGKQRAT